jgi:hypothetical protein
MVGREIEDSGSGLVDRFSDANRSVSTQVVHDDQVARIKRWCERLSHESKEGFRRRVSLVRQHCPNSIERHSYDCEYCATIAGTILATRSPLGPRAYSRVIEVCVQVSSTRTRSEGAMLATDWRKLSRQAAIRGGLAFLGDKGLLFRVKPSLATALTIVDRETASFCSAL